MDIYTICRKFWDLGIVEISVLDYVNKVENFNGNYSELGRAINKDVSATRKAVLKLESIGILHVEKKIVNKMEKMVSCSFITEWEYNLVNNS